MCLSEGGGFEASAVSAKYIFPDIRKHYGSVPFRIAKEPRMQGCSAYIIPKHAPWKEGNGIIRIGYQ